MLILHLQLMLANNQEKKKHEHENDYWLALGKINAKC